MFGFGKKKEPIIVTIVFADKSKSILKMPNFKEVKKAMINTNNFKYDKWLSNDEVYYPEDGFKITKINFNPKGKLETIEFTEQFEGGYNNG